MIKKNSFIIVLCSLITFSLTHAMDKPIIDTKELPLLAVNYNAPTIAFLGNTHLLTIVACKKPILIDITTEEKDEKLLYHKEDSWGIKTNSDKTKAIISGTDTLIVYDSQTDKTYINNQMYIKGNSPAHFTDIPDTVAITGIDSPLLFYNYITKKTTKHVPFHNIREQHRPFSSSSLVLLPLQQKLMISSNNDLYIYSNVNDKPQELDMRTITLSNEMTTGCTYNNDNSLMAFVDGTQPYSIKILNIETGKKTVLSQLKIGGIPLMQFHPSGAIFITALNGSIDYWHTKTSKRFAQQTTVLNKNLSGNYLSFSADGTHLAFAWQEKLEILKVPFETIGTCAYPLGNKDKMPFLLCALKNFQHNNEPLFPEIVKLLVQKTLAVSELTGN